eukprot:SAG31_NODE_2533_length_5554_cov_2.350623_4_plen_337_part_00
MPLQIIVVVASVFALLVHNEYYLSGCVFVAVSIYYANKWWYWWRKSQTSRQGMYIQWRQKWRWIKDDQPLRLWVYFFPILKSPFTRSLLPRSSRIWEWLEPELRRFPPDLLKDKDIKQGYAMFGSKWLPSVQTYVFFIILYVLEVLFGWVNLGLTIVDGLFPYLLPMIDVPLLEFFERVSEFMQKTVLKHLLHFVMHARTFARCGSHVVVRQWLWPELWDATKGWEHMNSTEFDVPKTKKLCDDMLKRHGIDQHYSLLCKDLILKQEDDILVRTSLVKGPQCCHAWICCTVASAVNQTVTLCDCCSKRLRALWWHSRCGTCVTGLPHGSKWATKVI